MKKVRVRVSISEKNYKKLLTISHRRKQSISKIIYKIYKNPLDGV